LSVLILFTCKICVISEYIKEIYIYADCLGDEIYVFGIVMAKIKVKQLEVGMTLTADVCDPNGRFLLGEGCELNEKHLKALNAWGVISVEINDDEIPDDTNVIEISPEIYKTIEVQVASCFLHNDKNQPVIKELIKESINFFIEKLGG